ncbi:MAG TPA: ABC transporter permease [Bryobacteraceae bacterium]|nr:ABC transporter permease [Bryobacteraceae bacterium]
MRFLLRRALHAVFLLASTSVLSFALVNLAPGDFFEAMRVDPNISSATVAALRSQHGMNKSLPIRYLHWLRSVTRGDWGFSFAYNSPAGPILWSRAKNTLLLTATATLLAWLIAVPLGIWAAVYPGTWADSLVTGTVSVLLATPELVLALLLLLAAVRTGYFPVGGLNSVGVSVPGSSVVNVWAETKDVTRHLVLPSVCLAAGLLPLLSAHIRTSVREALQAPFVTAALGHGIPFRRVLLRHALPAAANPLISLFGLSLGTLMSSSLLTEAIFSWPGLGQLMVEAIQQRDLFLIVDAGMLATGFLVAGNLAADLLLYASDSRIRAE